MLLEAVQEATKLKKEFFRLYFTGHACKQTGNWVTAVAGENISCEEVFDTIKSGGFNGKIHISLDCGYSGNWVHLANKRYNSGHKSFTSPLSIHIIASADCTHNC